MPGGRCCGCNGPMAVCRNCRCAKRNSPCVSCYPARKNMCQNLSSDDLSAAPRATAPRPSETPTSSTSSINEKAHLPTLLDDFGSFQRGSVLDRIPKGARHSAASALNSIIKSVCETDSEEDWRKLFRFSSLCFKKPKRGGKRQPSLATIVKRQIDDFLDDPLRPIEIAPVKHAVKHSPEKDT